ncbi:YtxH domain-containing protein [Bacillus marinisedimentorum]|uniref:YtxH domain-containing protein n=1 Tax=Bacillus marinisedimentorum TaxID=1821260 RepID=UPI0007E2548D|nr:YtxH domain-containing protein [Bacillus marinisedimentorum]
MGQLKSLMAGVVVGGVTAGAAILFTAPQSGKELRRNIQKCSGNVKDTFSDIKRSGIAIKEQVEQTSKESAVIIKDFSDDLKKSIEQWKKEIEPHQKKIQDELQKIEQSMDDLEKAASSK